MSNRLRTSVAAALLLLVALSALARDLKVVTWNLEWFPGRTPKPTAAAVSNHIAAAKEELRKLDPDIFCAQEVTDRAAFEDLISVVTNLRLHVISAFKADYTPVQQIAIASKLGSVSAWAEPWAQTKSGPPRGYSFAAIETGSNSALMVYSVHLKSNRGAKKDVPDNIAKREDSVEQLLEHIVEAGAQFKDHAIVGTVVAGDFNTNPENKELIGEKTLTMLGSGGMTNTWGSTPLEHRLTWRGSKSYPACTFDYFFVSGVGADIPHAVDTSADASDHRPVVNVIHVE